MKFGVFVAAILGFALAVFVILHVGLSPVLHAVGRVGTPGFVIICAVALLLLPVLAAGWYVLVPEAAGFAAFVVGRQIRDSSGDVLPFSQFAGIVIGARAAVLRGVAAPVAFASMIADVTTELMAQLAFILVGIVIFVQALPFASGSSTLANAMVIALALMVPGTGIFVALQRRGGRMAETLAERFLPQWIRQAATLHDAIDRIYAARDRVAASSLIHLAGWLGSGVGTWIMFRLMGGRIGILPAIAIEALLGGLRSIFVFVPSAIGIQEVGYATLVPLFGLPPEMGIAAALLKRAREITIGIPVLLAWQFMEGRRAFTRAGLQD
jgi:putative membrane protein